MPIYNKKLVKLRKCTKHKVSEMETKSQKYQTSVERYTIYEGWKL